MKEIPSERFREWSLRLRRSDVDAGAKVFRAFYPKLLRYACRLVSSEALAEDIVQESFLRLWRMRERLDPDRSLRSLLFVIVRNLAYNAPSRSHAPLDGHMRQRSVADPAERAGAEILAAHVRTWIDALPARRREAFLLSRFEGLTYAEIAEVMDVSVRTVENHIRLALEDLRVHIRQYEPSLLERCQ